MVKKRTVAVGLFGIGIVGAVVLWGVLRSSSSGSFNSRSISIPVLLRPSSILHIWLKTRNPSQATAAHIQLTAPLGNLTLAETHQHGEFEFHEVAPRVDGEALLEWTNEDTWVSYIYAWEPEAVLERGIRPAFIANAARFPDVREGYHFRPPLGWMNDPNGFSFYGGRFHLFYQAYPHSLRWSSMHWGHAVSRDLINWVHLPLFLLPDPSVSLEHEGNGGIFSGSAVVLPSRPPTLGIFYTDSLADRKPKEFQRFVTTLDGILPSAPALTVIPEGPSGLNLTQDFRDPNVFMGPDGKWKMVIGSKDTGGGIMLLYESADQMASTGWSFVSVLFRDNRYEMTVSECSALAPLGNPRDQNTLWALIYAQLDMTDPRTDRRNLSPAIVGTFDGRQFRPIFEQELDFGTSAYAFQAFYHSREGTLAIAWLANWIGDGWDWNNRQDFPTAMTIPRRLQLGPDRQSLLTPPIDLYTLRERRLDDRLLRSGQMVTLTNGTAEIRLNIDQRAISEKGLQLEIDHPMGQNPFRVAISTEGLEIVSGTPLIPHRRLIAFEARPREVIVLLDTGSIEVFGDNGRWAGTHRIASFDGFAGIRLNGDVNALQRIEAWTLRSAEFRGRLQNSF